uniref:DNA replication licensing factor MCM5 n=1 Tax=Gasterosteus aculeatus aculeatus TaxID=481459 RepID=A0AAQ4RGD2_GASAC
MSGFDDPGVYYSDSFGGGDGHGGDEGGLKKIQIKKRFREFLRQFRVGTDRTGFTYKYRDELKRHYTLGEYWVEVEMEDLASFDEDLSDCLYKLIASHVSRLVKVHGIIISATPVRAKATKVCLQCRSCRHLINNIPLPPGLQGYALPRKCNQAKVSRCSPSPRPPPPSRYLCDRVVPGNRVTIVGIYSIKKTAAVKPHGREKSSGVGIRASYLRVVGIQVDTEGAGRGATGSVTPQEEEELRALSASPNVYGSLARSVAPSIYGSEDLKKAITCLLFGGSRKRLPDGLTRRGDINLLMLGDPGTAKSQLLKFVERCSPIGVYTSGKGSSAAGLTASVLRDPHTRGFIMEGGAMVLADGGVVCIDEFDKMREDDRVAIHEAMEQQTISIAKAGITTTLNSRCSVLAAANSVFGRWDDTKGEDNIDFMPTILSRFDMIFIIKDHHDHQRDMTLARHVMNVHLSAQTQTEGVEGEIPLATFKKYIAYSRTKCGPRLSAAAAEKLKNRYVVMRSGAREHERESDKRPSIPITVRQLEAVVRIAESLAKMKLQAVAGEEEVDEALRLFQVSTLDAALSGSLSGVEGFTSQEDQEMISRVEKQMKRRFAIGSQVSEHSIVQDFTKQKYPEHAIYKVLQLMLRRGELQHRMQRKVLYRVK